MRFERRSTCGADNDKQAIRFKCKTHSQMHLLDIVLGHDDTKDIGGRIGWLRNRGRKNRSVDQDVVCVDIITQEGFASCIQNCISATVLCIEIFCYQDGESSVTIVDEFRLDQASTGER